MTDDLKARGWVPELLPCPFCGHTPRLDLREKRNDGDYFTLRCCHIDDFCAWSTVEEITAAWNRRAALSDHPAVRALVAEAEARGMERAAAIADAEYSKGYRGNPGYHIRAEAAAMKGETT